MDFIILILLHTDKKTMTTLKDFIEFCKLQLKKMLGKLSNEQKVESSL